MIKRQHGTFVCVSSMGMAYLGGYETFKAAQLHLGDTLDAELEGTGVIAFTIGPGLIPTETAASAVRQVAPLMGMTIEQFYELNKGLVLTPEEAGAGFAASIVFAEKFKGTETSSIQALKTADINFGSTESGGAAWAPSGTGQSQQALELCQKVLSALRELTDDWKHRSIFERQWVIRDFKKTAGMSAEEWLSLLEGLEKALQWDKALVKPPLERLTAYYTHLADLARGYERDPVKLEENLRHVYAWRDEADQLDKMLAK
jgi:hypothetical protein